MTGTQRWYHGGVPGLKRGDKILPPSQTGAVSISDVGHGTELHERAVKVHRKDLVYIAAAERDARMFARFHPAYGGRAKGGDIYEVVPDGPLWPDPDYLAGDGGSMACASATIVRIIERRVPRR